MDMLQCLIHFRIIIIIIIIIIKWFVKLNCCVVAVSSVSVSDMLDQLRQEQQTWQLVSSLYSDRLDSRSQIDVDEDVASVGRSFCNNNLVYKLP